MSAHDPCFDPPSRPGAAAAGTSPWRVWPLGRNRWLLLREDDPIAELGVLGTAEWWVRPIGDDLPWADVQAHTRCTRGSRNACIQRLAASVGTQQRAGRIPGRDHECRSVLDVRASH